MSAIGGKAGCDRDSSDLGELGEFGGIAEVAVVIALCVLAPSPREKFVQFSVQRCPGFGQRLDCLTHSTDPSVTTAPADFLERLDATPWGAPRPAGSQRRAETCHNAVLPGRVVTNLTNAALAAWVGTR